MGLLILWDVRPDLNLSKDLKRHYLLPGLTSACNAHLGDSERLAKCRVLLDAGAAVVMAMGTWCGKRGADSECGMFG